MASILKVDALQGVTAIQILRQVLQMMIMLLVVLVAHIAVVQFK